MHLVGCTTRIYYDARPYERQICKTAAANFVAEFAFVLAYRMQRKCDVNLEVAVLTDSFLIRNNRSVCTF